MGKFERDKPAACKNDPVRKGIQLQKSIARDKVFASRYRKGHGSGSGSQDEISGPNRFSGNRQGFFIDKTGISGYKIDSRAPQPLDRVFRNP